MSEKGIKVSENQEPMDNTDIDVQSEYDVEATLNQSENETENKSKKGKKKKKSNKKSVDESIDNIKDKAKNMTYTTKKTVFLAVIALAIFLGTFFVQYVLTEIIAPAESTRIVNWMFVTGQSDTIVANATTFNQAEQSNLISKPLGDKYMRCVYNTDGNSGGKILKVVTEYSPIKILADGEEIYNNNYGKTEIVGNSYNEVVLPESEESQMIELFIYYPFGFNLQADIVDNGYTNPFALSNFADNWSLQLSLAVILLGLIFIITIFAMMFRSKDIVVLFSLGFTLIASGLALFAKELSTHTMYFNLPFAFALANTLTALVICLIISNIHSLSVKKNRFTVVAASLSVIATAPVWVPNVMIMQVGLIVSAILMGVAAVMLFTEISHVDNISAENNSAIRIASFYVVFAYLFNCVATALGLWKYSLVLLVVSLIVTIVTLYFVYVRNIAKKNLREHIAEEKDDSFALVFSAISDIISQQEGISSKESYIKGICEKTINFLEKSDILSDNKAITCCAAMKNNGTYNEIYRYGNVVKPVDFNGINEILSDREDRYIVGSSFFELAIGEHNEVILVFDNTFNAESKILVNLVSSLFSSANISYSNFINNINNETNQKNIYMNIANLAETKSKGTLSHLDTVEKMTFVLAKYLGYGEKAKLIAEAAKLHDIGKVSVNSEILMKKGPLTPEERYQIQQHVISGYNILYGLDGEFFEIARQVVLEHHENYDGTGYLRKKGQEISPYARIVKVADVFDALMSKRSYKESWSLEDSISYIYEHKGTEFDPDVVDAFIECGAELIEIKEQEKE